MMSLQKKLFVAFALMITLSFTMVIAHAAPAPAPAAPAAAPMPPSPKPETWQMVSLSPQQEADIAKIQQDTQVKYLQSVNELQLMKLNREISEVNQNIMASKLATITTQKNIVDLLSKPQETPGANPPGGAAHAAGTPPPPPVAVQPPPPVEANYKVASVTQLMGQWNAVLTLQTKIFSVAVGDVLPPDGSTVIAIGRYGVVLEKGGVQRRVLVNPSL